MRLIEATEGQITIDGVDVSRIGLRTLRSRLTMIPQEPTLYSGTLRSNLDPFGDFADDELHQVIRLTHLDRLFLRNPASGETGQGLEHPVGEQVGADKSLGKIDAVEAVRRTRCLIIRGPT